MKSLFAGLSAAVLVTCAASVAFAGPSPSPKPVAAPKTITCPACKMPMGMTKTAKTPVAVPIKGKTYYCCADCAAGKEMAKKAAATKKPTATPAPKTKM
jgi:hypothetical protein